MEVRCDRCGSRFDFDSQQIPREGLAVECSQCHSIFNVFSEHGESGPGIWRLRQASGDLFEFKELTTLQRWIVEGKIGRNGEISRTGNQWKRLGDIAELAAFFQVLDRAEARDMPTGLEHTPTQLPTPMPPAVTPTGPGMTTLPTPTQVQPGQWGQDMHLQPYAPGASSVAVQDSPPTPIVQPLPAAAEEKPATHGPLGPTPPMVGPTLPAEEFSMAEPDAGVDAGMGDSFDEGFVDDSGPAPEDLDPFAGFVQPPESRKGRWIALFLLVGLGAGGAYIYEQQPEWIPEEVRTMFLSVTQSTGQPATPLDQLAAGRAELDADTATGLAAAEKTFKAHLDNPENAEAGSDAAHLGLAQVALARADLAQRRVVLLGWKKRRLQSALRTASAAEKRGLLPRLGQAPTAYASEIQTLIQQIKEATVEAREAAQTTTTLMDQLSEAAPQSAVDLLRADHHRHRGEGAAAKRLLDKVAAMDPAEAHQEVALVRALLAAQVPDQHKTADRELADVAQHFPRRIRLFYARAQLAFLARQEGTAKELVDAILERSPEHAATQWLRQHMSLLSTDGESDAGALGTMTVDNGAAPAVAAAPISFDQILSQAERARTRDSPRKAMRLLQQALALKPNDADALAGLGWAHLDLENPGAAIVAFNKILRHAPRFSDAHMGLAEAYKLKGQKGLALKHYRKYLDILPSGPDANIARRMIKQLQ